jgi:hypothetical protein
MRIRPFTHGVASLVFALFAAAPLTAMAVSVCPSGAVCIDESIEGRFPSVTSDSPFFQGSVVSRLSDETWQIQITMSGVLESSIGFPLAFLLREPGSGTISDMLVFNGTLVVDSSTIVMYLLSSDDESGNIVNVDLPTQFCPGGTCVTEVEDGTFQLAFRGADTTAVTFDVYLKSDVEAVPEPSTGLLLALGVITLATRLRCRNRNVRPARHSAITEVRRSSPSSQAAPS